MMVVEKIQMDIPTAMSVVGAYNANARLFVKQLEVDVVLNGDVLTLSGEADAVDIAVRAINALVPMAQEGEEIKPRDVMGVIALAREGAEQDWYVARRTIAVTSRGKTVKCRTVGQHRYMRLVDKHDLVFCVGPAGTGKTYLAVCRAVSAYRNKEVERIVLTRPAVEAGERLGFLPGDLQQKVDPYLRPLYDALGDLLGQDNFVQYASRGIIEVAPLAYMRGRTLNNSYIILDEAQNTTVEQMKMFLTRMGEGSRVIVTGDTTQIDLPHGQKSGMLDALDVLRDVEGVGICRLTSQDVVRHDLVQRIVDAYARAASPSTKENKTDL
jgi:phosphate starvation-inducible PhoH-like protein